MSARQQLTRSKIKYVTGLVKENHNIKHREIQDKVVKFAGSELKSQKVAEIIAKVTGQRRQDPPRGPVKNRSLSKTKKFTQPKHEVVPAKKPDIYGVALTNAADILLGSLAKDAKDFRWALQQLNAERGDYHVDIQPLLARVQLSPLGKKEPQPISLLQHLHEAVFVVQMLLNEMGYASAVVPSSGPVKFSLETE